MPSGIPIPELLDPCHAAVAIRHPLLQPADLKPKTTAGLTDNIVHAQLLGAQLTVA